MVIGYTLGGNASNDGIFFENAPDGTLCPDCSTCLNHEYYPKEMKIHPSKKYDVSYTWDLRTLFSAKFADFCEREFGLGISTRKISSSTGNLFHYVPSSIIEFDAAERGTRFINKCASCRNYEEVIGATPVFLKSRELIKDGFHRTDLEFSSGASKHPLLIVSVSFYEVLKKGNFRGLFFEEILDDPWEAIHNRRKKTNQSELDNA